MTNVKSTAYREAYECAAAELESLLKQQEEISKHILTLRKTLHVLSTLPLETGDVSLAEEARARTNHILKTTITDDILQVVVHASHPLTSSEIRDEVNKLGGRFLQHKNPLATIDAILSRLLEKKRVRKTSKGGRTAWVVGFSPSASLGSSNGRKRNTSSEDR